MSTHFFVGNLVDVPEFHISDDGVASLRMRIAVNDSYRDSSGAWKNHDAVFWDCYAYRKIAENLHEAAFAKGQSLIVEGRIATQAWQTEDGARHSRHILYIVNAGVNSAKPLQRKEPHPTQPTTGVASGGGGQWDTWAGEYQPPAPASPGALPGMSPAHAESSVGL